MDKAHIIWIFQWLLYCFLHSFLANPYIKNLAATTLHLGARAYRITYNIIAFVHLFILVVLHLRLNSKEIFTGNGVTVAIAATLLVVGITVMILCISKYFRQLSGAFESSSAAKLYTGGLHQLVRHPLYFGTFLLLLGALLYWPLVKNLVVVSIIIGYTLIGMLLEEKKLLKEFGASYSAYQDKVPMIIPGFRFGRKKRNPATGSVP